MNRWTLGLLRPGQEDIETVTVVRAEVDVPTVLGESRRADGTWDFLLPSADDGRTLGLLRVTKFAGGTAREIAAALAAVECR